MFPRKVKLDRIPRQCYQHLGELSSWEAVGLLIEGRKRSDIVGALPVQFVGYVEIGIDKVQRHRARTPGQPVTRLVRAWRLVSADSARNLPPSPAEASLVGREAELARLRAALDGAAAAQECRLVTVIGSPGVGKTRLARELGRTVSEWASVVEGHCEATGEGITFLPIAEVLRLGGGDR
jgi:hypothetical protein